MGINRYYCPFCSLRFQFQKNRSDGLLTCVQCGDPLIKEKFIDSRQIVGLIVATAFVAPLLIMIFFLINDFTKETLPMNSESSVVSIINK